MERDDCRLRTGGQLLASVFGTNGCRRGRSQPHPECNLHDRRLFSTGCAGQGTSNLQRGGVAWHRFRHGVRRNGDHLCEHERTTCVTDHWECGGLAVRIFPRRTARAIGGTTDAHSARTGEARDQLSSSEPEFPRGPLLSASQKTDLRATLSRHVSEYHCRLCAVLLDSHQFRSRTRLEHG